MFRSRIACCLFFVLAFFGAIGRAHAQCSPQWLPGDGIPGVEGAVYAATTWDSDGDGPLSKSLVIAGRFSIAGTTKVSSVAMWSGGQWVPLGSEIFTLGGVYALAVMPNGDLYAAGEFLLCCGNAHRVARWNGTAWAPVGLGIGGSVYSLAALPNGDLVAAGRFSFAGNRPAANVARWNGTDWSPFGVGLNGEVDAIAVLPDGNLIAAGQFTRSGPAPVEYVAKWNGTQWLPLSSGSWQTDNYNTFPEVRAIRIMPNGDLIVGGNFTRAGGVAANRVARWDGTQWAPVGPGPGIYNSVRALAVRADRSLIAGGTFNADGFSPANFVSRWDGHAWQALGTGLNGFVYAFCTLPAGELFAGGEFSLAGNRSAKSAAVWDGANWKRFGSGFNDRVFCIAVGPDAAVVAGGWFESAGGVDANYIAKWDGAAWTPLGSGMSGGTTTSGYINTNVRAVAFLPGGDLVAGGSFTNAGGTTANFIAKWNGSAWSSLGTGLNGPVLAIAVEQCGDIVVGGEFNMAGETPVSNIARWNGVAWSPLGAGTTEAVRSLAVLPNGDVLAGGNFVSAGGVVVHSIAKWNGIAWSGFGTGMSGGGVLPSVNALALLPNGEIVAGGSFLCAGDVPMNNIARWDGTQWLPLDTGITSSFVNALTLLPDGRLLVGGSFSTIGSTSASCIAVWSQGSWSPLGNGIDGVVDSLGLLPNGEVVAGGMFTSAGAGVSARFARWTENAKPWIALQPRPQAVIASDLAAISATPANGFAETSSRWQREAPSSSGSYTDIVNGPGGASQGGGTVSGASGQLPSPTDGTPATLTISNIQPSDAGMYRVTFWNSCGEATSVPVEVKVKAHISDINADGQVDDADFILFSAQYDLMLCTDPAMPDSCSADFNQDGFVDDADFTVFVPVYNTMLF